MRRYTAAQDRRRAALEDTLAAAAAAEHGAPGSGTAPVVDLGEAVHVESMRSKLKAPGTERLKLKYDNLLSNFAFKFNLRR